MAHTFDNQRPRQFRFKPSEQGDHDGLCGVYAIINAVTALVPQSQRRVSNRILFQRITANLPSALLLDAVHSGLDADTLTLAARRALNWMRSRGDPHLLVRRVFARTSYCDQAEAWSRLSELDHNHAVLVLSLDTPSCGHWTVLKGISGDTLTVCDSMQLTVLQRGWFDGQQPRFAVRLNETVMISLPTARPDRRPRDSRPSTHR